ncbi:TetR family transcriptional regulator [Yinghuangia aomiensis]|uniref:TetR family transcriptional regulator n=1 Tax=Yinghuangia aomiensis TaxID=676205 RepID=A0ABP9GXN5_9ACTN
MATRASATADHADVPRARSAEATAAALLDAAVARFARDGYEATSVRDIAADAGVNPALIYRYFGSKEKLFVEAVTHERNPASIINGPVHELADRSVSWFRSRPTGFAGESPLVLMVQCAGREGVAELLREQLRANISTLAEKLEGPDAEIRAALLLSLNIGMGMITSIADVRILADAPPERLQAYLADAFAPLIADPETATDA